MPNSLDSPPRRTRRFHSTEFKSQIRRQRLFSSRWLRHQYIPITHISLRSAAPAEGRTTGDRPRYSLVHVENRGLSPVVLPLEWKEAASAGRDGCRCDGRNGSPGPGPRSRHRGGRPLDVRAGGDVVVRVIDGRHVRHAPTTGSANAVHGRRADSTGLTLPLVCRDGSNGGRRGGDAGSGGGRLGSVLGQGGTGAQAGGA